MGAQWSPLVVAEPPANAEAIGDVAGLLDRLVAGYGVRAVARLLDVNASMVTRWKAGKPISATMARRIIDVHYVLNRALQIMAPSVVAVWLVGSEPFLGGARPIDALAIKGIVPVIEALQSIEDGAYY